MSRFAALTIYTHLVAIRVKIATFGLRMVVPLQIVNYLQVIWFEICFFFVNYFHYNNEFFAIKFRYF